MFETYPDPMSALINEFQKMPSIGPKSAQRLAFYILGLSDNDVENFSSAMKTVKEKVKFCSKCHNITVSDPCNICADDTRDKSTICVVSEPREMIAIEKTGEFKGSYHILGGLISPLEGINPESLRIKELLHRIQENDIKEIFLALNPTIEGEATVLYLSKLIKPIGLKLTRIAYGLPVGSNIDYADEITLTRAYEGRVNV
jgi:recombination protein RecR